MWIFVFISLLTASFVEAQLSECFLGTQFEFVNINVTFTEAQEACQAEGNNLATILNEETNQFVIDFLNSIDASDTWIGLTRSPPSDSLDAASFSFVSGADNLDFGNISGVDPWGEGDPNLNNTEDDTCVVIDVTDVWFDRFCIQEFTFLCEQTCQPTFNPSQFPTLSPTLTGNPTTSPTKSPTRSPNVEDLQVDGDDEENLLRFVFIGLAGGGTICLLLAIFGFFRERNLLKNMKIRSDLKESQLKLLIT